jgi:leucyl-tRNA synthetase
MKKPAAYNHIQIEKKWQKEWTAKKVYETLSAAKAKTKKLKPYYVLDMFPYPSGAGLHVGHPRGYIGSDVFARQKRMEGFNVLHPMGYDAFGLPAEQFAIANKMHPRKAVEKNVATFEKQLSIIGLSYDWSRKVNTTDPEYYRWTQWIFLKLYNSYFDTAKNKAQPIETLVKQFGKNGNAAVSAVCDVNVQEFSAKEWNAFSDVEKHAVLMKYRLAYEGYSEVNWCPKLGTVLANDEIVDSPDGPVSERGGFPVEKKSTRQWFMRITAYADRLIEGLDELDWSAHIKEIQKNWIGRSEGSEIEFCLVTSSQNLIRDQEEKRWIPGQARDDTVGVVSVFTTRADTLFGVTYVVLAPEHPLIDKMITHIQNWDDVYEYITNAKKKNDEERTDATKEKTGVPLKGITAINPANGESVPVWISDYVLAGYGTGAVMAVPAHDERDFEFAKKYHVPVRQVTARETGQVRDNEEFKNGGAAVVFDPKTQKYAVASFADGKCLLFAGGVSEGETVHQCILREVEEESGLHNFKHVEWIETSYAHYFNTMKKVNRVARAECLLVVLEDSHTNEVHRELHENFTLAWKSAGEIKKWWMEHNDEDGLKHYIRFLDQSVARAIELGYDTTSDAKNFISTAMTDYGILENSGSFDGMKSEEAKKKITEFVGGKIVTKYKLRDAVFARQRYWGEPIPLVHKKDGTIEMVAEKKLPLTLPNVKSYEPTGTGESPLASVPAWVKAGYETNTMPGWAGSSWYFLRYMDPKNKKAFADEKEIGYWKNVDMYVGGAEHATGHLLYSRFWHKFLKDYNLVPTEEPFKALRNQGMIGGADGRKMSKRWGNVVNPDDVVKLYGADSLRVFEMFLGPFDSALPWSTEGIIGSRRFIEKIWRLASRVSEKKTAKTDEKQLKALHKTIKKVTEDIAGFNFNTAISAMMICVSEMENAETINANDFKMFLQILAPFAPHMTEELWKTLGEKKSIHVSGWPKWNPKLLVEDEVTIAIQVNGKVRGEITVAIDAEEADVVAMAKQVPSVEKYLTTEPKRIIYVKGRLINIVV